MSAKAPLGSPNRNTGNVDAVCTRATITGLVVSVVISHAAATSFIHIVMLAASQASHRPLKTGPFRGAGAAGVIIAVRYSSKRQGPAWRGLGRDGAASFSLRP